MNAYVFFNGQCEQAFQFYQRVLGAKIESMMKFEGSPAAESVPAEWRSKVIHGRINLDGQVLMASDPPPGRYQRPQGFSISLSVKQTGEAERIFQALAEGGQVMMPVQETFWAARFGMLVDQFGIPWMVDCETAG